MKKTLLLLLLCTSTVLIYSRTFAQSLPYVYDVENTCADCILPEIAPFENLPSIPNLPNPFEWADGRGTITNFGDWTYRRAEIGAFIHHFQTGTKPVKPDDIEATFEDGLLTVHVTVDGNTLTLSSAITLPDGDGPFPVLIGMGGRSGSMPEDMLTNRNIAMMPFNFGQVMSHTQNRGQEPINQLYPDLRNIGAYSAWPWGVSRLIDGLELIAEEANIDMERLAVSGCSFAGKMALYAGSFDERIALTISHESGGGGLTSWRFAETLSGVEKLSNTNYAWFKEGFSRFGTHVNKLPTDQHELMAMVAPRALFVTANPGHVWLGNEAGYVSSCAAEEVWNALEIPERFGYSVIGGHGHCDVPAFLREEIEAFIDKFLIGMDDVDTIIRSTVYDTDLDPWITWSTPELVDGKSFMDRINLTYPENAQAGLTTSVNLQWEPVDKASVYHVQLATNNHFTHPLVDESISETSLMVHGLEEGVTYYWRAQVENTEGVLGPWGQPNTFSTYIDLPGSIKNGQINPHPSRADFIRFTWHPTENATHYSLELATQPDFETGLQTGTSSDTTLVISGTQEGRHYFWRVRGENITGVGEWSETRDFMLILAPANLRIEQTGSGEITLHWQDVSRSEDGYEIERRSSNESAFDGIDTVPANTTSYVDTGLSEGTPDYTYRIKAYVGDFGSDYSNEASLTITQTDDLPEKPSEFSLHQNYPNPFNPSTTISFEIPKSANVQLDVFNILGQKLDTIIDKPLQAGSHTVIYDAGGLSSGVYFYTLRTGNLSETKSFSLVK